MDPADLMLVSFKEHLRVETVPAEGACLVSERGVTALSGPSIEKLAPLLDGTRTVDQVKRELAADLQADEVAGLLGHLSDAGLIGYFPAHAAGRRDEQALAYWNLAGVDGDSAASAAASSPVEVIATGRGDPEAVAAVCRASGLTVAEPGSGTAALSLVLCEDYLDPALRVVNADHLVSRRPWLLAKVSGAAAWIGPVFQPAAGPCWACLAKRLEGNRLGSFLMRRDAESGGSGFLKSASLPASRGVALHIAVLEAAKWLGGVRHEGQRGVYVLDTMTMRGAHHMVARRPQCASCGDPGLVTVHARKPVTMIPRRIAADGNGHRVLPPEKVLEKHGHLVDPVTGIVPELRRDPGCPEFLHSFLSGRNRAMAQSSVASLRYGIRARSGGKGATELEAKVGALCEAVERYCGTRDGDEPVVRETYRGLGEAAVHPNTCQLYHERQFADRERWNTSCAPFHHVPVRFDENAVTEWTPVWSLLGEGQKLLPTAMLYYNPDPGRAPASVLADSNGNASGACLEDAVLQGFFELVERDAVAMWWYNRTRQPAVDLDSFGDPWAAGLPAIYAQMNRQVWVLDVTSDFGIPVMAALSRRTDKPAEDIMLGFGAHFDPRIALRRALTELGQMMSPVARVRADGTGYGVKDPHLVPWWKTANIANQPYLAPDSSETPRTAVSYRYTPTSELDLPRMCDTARRAGLDILVLDQTRPDIGLPVVKVIVPGLRHFWPRFGPGRLYDVPVRLGRLARATAYEDLNPIPIFL